MDREDLRHEQQPIFYKPTFRYCLYPGTYPWCLVRQMDAIMSLNINHKMLIVILIPKYFHIHHRCIFVALSLVTFLQHSNLSSIEFLISDRAMLHTHTHTHIYIFIYIKISYSDDIFALSSVLFVNAGTAVLVFKLTLKNLSQQYLS